MLVLLDEGLFDANALQIKPVHGSSESGVYKLECSLRDANPIILASGIPLKVAQSILQDIMSARQGDIFVASKAKISMMLRFK